MIQFINMISAINMMIIAVLSTVTVTTATPPTPTSNPLEKSQFSPPLYASYPSESYQLPTNLELPRESGPPAPFYTVEPNQVLRAPYYITNEEQEYYGVPVPSQELRAPPVSSWNPDNDPKYFYEVPLILTRQEQPTKYYPKKYNKDIHSKGKPFASKPKQELLLLPISEKQLNYKQKQLDKTIDNLDKKENQKSIQVEQSELQAAETNSFSSSHHNDLISPHSSSSGERLDFHVVGHDGPHSYKWGYDTGKGHNRHFRYEEKDKTGMVKGHFGFFDKLGKLQMVNYNSHPHDGFHAEGNFGNN